jgi:hypothetical protein
MAFSLRATLGGQPDARKPIARRPGPQRSARRVSLAT